MVSVVRIIGSKGTRDTFGKCLGEQLSVPGQLMPAGFTLVQFSWAF